jgi:hypothetical protein
MPGNVFRGALRTAVLILGLALVLLPFQPRGSAEFVVTVLSAVVGALFVGVVLLAMRWARPGLPPLRDKRDENRLTGAAPTNGEGRD